MRITGLILLFIVGGLVPGLAQETDPDRPGMVFIPDNEGSGCWFPLRPGEKVECALARAGLSRSQIAAIQEKLRHRNAQRPVTAAKSCLAAVTCYWSKGSGTDRWTRRCQSSTGVPLTRGVVAVDPRVIPYGSLIKIEGVDGWFVAADCGRDVLRRVAVKHTARTGSERRAVVVDVYFRTEQEGRAFDRSLPAFVKVRYYPPA